MSYRNKRLLDAADGQSCLRCGRVGTTVACHANSVALGKGTGIKCPDFYTIALCFDCHALYDGRQGTLTKLEKHELFTSAFYRQVARWFEQGTLIVR